MNTDLNPTSPTRAQWIALALILLIASVLRFHGLTTDSLWTDELQTLAQSTGHGLDKSVMPRGQVLYTPPHPTGLADARPWWNVWRAMDTDTHPPLHPMLLRFWRDLFGEGDVAARSISAVISVLGVLFLFHAVRLLHGTNSALWAALLMSVAPAQIEFAQFVRSYVMLITTVAAACAAMASIVTRGPSLGRCAALGVSMLIAMLTHYAAAGPLLGIALFGLVHSDRRVRVRVFATCVIAALIFAAIWGPTLLAQRNNFAVLLDWSQEDRQGHLVRTLQRLMRLPMRFFFEPRERADVLSAASCVLYFLPLLVMRRRPAWALWWLVLLGAVIPVLVSDLLRASNLLGQPRYTIAGSLAAYAIVGAVGELLHNIRARLHLLAAGAIPASVALACALTLPDFYARRQPDFRDFGSYLAARFAPGDAIVIIEPSGTPWAADIYWLAITHYRGAAPSPMVILTHPPDADLMRALESCEGTIWIVGGGEEMFPESKHVEARYFHQIARVSGVRLW